MHRTILAATAAAVLMSAAGAVQAQTTDWTGAYVGVFAGYADRKESGGETVRFDNNLDGRFGDTVNTAAGANAFSPGFCGGSYSTNAAAGGCRKDDDTDVEMGVRAGYDYQFMGNWVVGGVVEYSQLQLADAVTAFSTTPASYAFTRKLNNVFAVRVRGGYAVDDNLFYATGGFARGSVRHSFNTTNTANGFTPSGGDDADGYQLGFGYERKIIPNVTLGLEFLHTNLKDDDFSVRAGNSGTTPANNPFLLGNASGTDFRRGESRIKYNTFRVTTAYRF